jgi:hypothetical protein
MSDEPKTLDEAKAIIRERDVEIRMLAAAGAAKAAARAADAAAASGKKPLGRSEFEAKPPDVKRKLMLSGEYVLFDD